MTTALEMKPDERRKYNPLKNRSVQTAEKQYLKERRGKAMKVAEEAATLLKTEYNAEKIVVFGSLATENFFSEWSDIDLAVWGIPSEKYYSAVAAVTGLSPDFKVDLVEAKNCRNSVKESIDREGIEI